MSLTPEQYLALAQITNQNFNWPADENKTINQLLTDYALPGEGTPVLAALSSIGGYTLVNFQPNTASGFAGAAFQAPPGPNGEPGEIVFAFRGTEPNLSADFTGAIEDFKADLEIATNTNLSGPSQFNDAFDFWSKTLQSVGSGNYADYSFTGHSLGGGLAQYMTYKTNEVGHSVTFNAVGIGGFPGLNGLTPSDYNDSITDYVNQNDIVGQYGTQLGQTIYKTDTGNYQFNSAVDNGQLALQMAVAQAIQQGNLTQAAGIAALNALSEVSQGAFNAESDVLFGAHGLDAMVSPNGSLSQTVAEPNAAIATLTQVINKSFSVSSWILDGINYFAVEIFPATGPVGEAVVKVTLAIFEGDVQVVTTIGEQVYNWVNFMGETTADIIYNTAIAVGNVTNTVAEVAANLYQFLFGDYVTINGTGNADSLSPSMLNPVPYKSSVINGYAGDDSISGSSYNDSLDGGDGNDYVSGSDGNDYAYGRSGEDILVGGWGADVLVGGSGNDSLYGESEGSTGWTVYPVPLEDVLDGGVGNDLLAGGAGNDTYIFGRGYGQDVIDDKFRSAGYESFGSGGSLDTISFLAGIVPTDIKVLRRNQNDLELSVIGTTDKITIRDYFSYYGLGNGTIEQVTFANGVIWDATTLQDKARYISEATYDAQDPNTLLGYANQADIIQGTSADEIIVTYEGDDLVNGDAGNDIVTGYWGNDTLRGGAGDDILYGDYQDSTGWNPSYTANDILDGGAGNDLMIGDGGDDTYVFGRGYGTDTIDDKHRSGGYESYGGGGFDTVTFLPGVAPEDVVLYRNNSDQLEISIIGTTDKLIVQNFYNYYGASYGAIEQITFTDGTVWDLATILEKAQHVDGTSSDDTIIANSQIIIAHAGDGNDTVTGSQYADQLYGQSGNDTLNGDIGNDTLDGGTGSDMLQGGGNDDTYIFGIGYGHDTILDYSTHPYYGIQSGGFDTVSFTSGITPENIEVYRRGMNDLEFRIIGTDDLLTIKNHYYDNGKYAIDQVMFSDGTIWDAQAIQEKVINIYGTDEDEILYGSSADNVITGGAGTDQLIGGAGNDTYVFGLGYGVDTIFDSDATSGNQDKITFLEGVNPNDVNVTRNGNNIELSIVGAQDKLIIERYFSAYNQSNTYVGEGAHKIESIQFSDNTTWGMNDLEDKIRHMVGTPGDDQIYGYDDLHTVISAGAGNDTIFTGSLGDEISGGTGNDASYGGIGNDTYIFAIGDGQDTIYEASGTDTIRFAAGINPDNITAKRVERYNGGNTTYYDLELSIASTNDKITIQSYFGYYGYNGLNTSPNQMIEQITFADETVWTQSTIYDKVHSLVGTAGDDSLLAYDNGAVSYQGVAGNDTLNGAGGDDTLDGGADNDTLNGGSGNDDLIGGIGNDSLGGGSGDDSYVFALGDGQDVIYEESGNDTIQFATGISPDDVTVKRVERYNGGNTTYYDLQISIAGSSDAITVLQYFGYSGWNGTGASPNQMIEQITFADGTTWTQSTIYDKVHNLTGTSESDTISAYDSGAVIFHGLAGNDNLSGGTGNDTLDGGADNDGISGGAGNDTVIGGIGNDSLYAGSGDDTYVFALGDGQDVIYEENGTDTVQFGAGVGPSDITVKRIERPSGNTVYYDLELGIAGTNDKIIVQQYFGYSGWNGTGVSPNQMIEQIIFADETVWAQSTIYDKVHNLVGTANNDSFSAYDNGTVNYQGLAGDDSLTGNTGNDLLDGGDGADYLSGSGGNDTLIGGAGNDGLDGGSSDDTYVFSSGDGQDIIYEYGGGADEAELNRSLLNVMFERVGNDLRVAMDGSTDTVTVASWYNNTNYQVETFKASDGSTITNTQIEQLIQAMASFSTDNGMSWSEALDSQSATAQSVISQYWTAPTV